MLMKLTPKGDKKACVTITFLVEERELLYRLYTILFFKIKIIYWYVTFTYVTCKISLITEFDVKFERKLEHEKCLN